MTLEALRYWFAWLGLGSLPAAVLYWYLVHPFIGFWRRVGKAGTFTAMALLFVVNLAVAWRWRDALLGEAPPPSPAFVAIGAVLYLAAAVLQMVVRRQLKVSILAGVPELDPDGNGGELLDQGVYARVRHPRYVTIVVGMLGMAFLVDYPSVWIVWLLLVPALYGIVVMEERELRQRFGARYAEYAARVPRFLPRRRG